MTRISTSYCSQDERTLARIARRLARRVWNGFYMAYNIGSVFRLIRAQFGYVPSKSASLAPLDLRSVHTEVINLVARADRRALITSRLSLSGLPFYIHEATAPANIDQQSLCSYFTNRSQRMLTVGSIASAMSHIALWERLLRSGVSHALILEDDAMLAAPWSIETPLIVPDSFDIVFLGSGDARIERMGARITASLFKPLITRRGLYAYLVSREGLSRLLATVLPIGATAGGLDTAIGKAILHQQLNAFTCMPPIFEHDDALVSDILNPSKPHKRINSA
jgi:hypothetical protein